MDMPFILLDDFENRPNGKNEQLQRYNQAFQKVGKVRGWFYPYNKSTKPVVSPLFKISFSLLDDFENRPNGERETLQR